VIVMCVLLDDGWLGVFGVFDVLVDVDVL